MHFETFQTKTHPGAERRTAGTAAAFLGHYETGSHEQSRASGLSRRARRDITSQSRKVGHRVGVGVQYTNILF